MLTEAQFVDRDQYLQVRFWMTSTGGSFYFDVLKGKDDTPRRHMRVKGLDEKTARELYYQIVGLLGSNQGVKLYASRWTSPLTGKVYYEAHPDTVRVTVPAAVIATHQES